MKSTEFFEESNPQTSTLAPAALRPIFWFYDPLVDSICAEIIEGITPIHNWLPANVVRALIANSLLMEMSAISTRKSLVELDFQMICASNARANRQVASEVREHVRSFWADAHFVLTRTKSSHTVHAFTTEDLAHEMLWRNRFESRLAMREEVELGLVHYCTEVVKQFVLTNL
jgi:hypothetical protein